MRKLTNWTTLFILSLLPLTTTQAFAFSADNDTPPLVQEVFIGEVVYPQEKGDFQFTLAPEYQEGRSTRTTLLPIMVEYGLTDRWQIGMNIEALKIRNPQDEPRTQGRGDLEIGTKYSFMHINHSDYSAALGLNVTFPTGDINKELTEGFRKYEPYMIFAKDLPNLCHGQVYTQIGLGLLDRQKSHEDPEEDEPKNNEFFWNAGLIIPYQSIRFITEANLETNRWIADGNEEQIFITPGIAWKPNKAVEIGLGAPIGVTSQSDHYRIIAMLTIEV